MTEDAQRLDLWLWQARFCKSRSLASRLCKESGVRVNGQPSHKAHQAVRPGDTLTFALAGHVRVIKLLSLAERRGPATEARLLYEDLAPPTPANRLPPSLEAPVGLRAPGSGRPTKRDRRQLEALRREP